MSAHIIGVDEVGRGCLAGPVVVCSYIATNKIFENLKDSKAYSATQREKLDIELRNNGIYSIISQSPETIDKINILQATLLSMAQSIEELFKHLNKTDAVNTEPKIIIDGNQIPPGKYFSKLPPPMSCLVNGDKLVYEIAAASILAKVYRDNLMVALEKEFPGYGFASHKGYGTKKHIQAIKDKGFTKLHRLSFKPKELFEKGNVAESRSLGL